MVITPDGLVLDGRNRVAACDLAGVEPDTVTYDGDDLAEYVIDANITRRNMSTGARAMATALVLQAAGRRNGGRWQRDSITQDSALSRGWQEALRQAGTVLDFKPDLAQDVVSGDVALDAAYQEAKDVRDAAERDKNMMRELAGTAALIERRHRHLGRSLGRTPRGHPQGTRGPAAWCWR